MFNKNDCNIKEKTNKLYISGIIVNSSIESEEERKKFILKFEQAPQTDFPNTIQLNNSKQQFKPTNNSNQ